MKYVPIVPHGAERLLDVCDAERVFCFADIANKDQEYANWFRKTQLEVLMDHPVYELEPALGLADTLAVLDYVQPKVTTIPDVHEDFESTMENFGIYAPVMKSEFPNMDLMGVPQGLTVDQILESAYTMADSGYCNMLGIGVKRSIPDLDRAMIVDILHREWPEMRFHLLGARWPYNNERKMALCDWVESIDTAEPVNAAMRGVKFERTDRESVKRDANFQNMARRAMMQTRMTCQNIKAFQNLIATPVEQSVEGSLMLR